MTGFFDKLNLRPGERRALAAVGLAVFFVVNVVWVWPRFSDWNRAQKRLEEIRKTNEVLQVEIKLKPQNDKLIREFDAETQTVLPEDQATVLMRAYQSQASQSGVLINVPQSPSLRTNENFVEQSQTINFISEEAALVDFLYKLGSGGASVRAKGLSLRPSQQHDKLQGSVTLVASFQRKPAPRPVVAPATPASAKPAGATTNKPAAAAAGTNKPAGGVAPTNKPAAPVPRPPAVTTNRTPARPPASASATTNKPAATAPAR